MGDGKAFTELMNASDDLRKEDLARMLELYGRMLRELDYGPIEYKDTSVLLGGNMLRGTGKTDALQHAAWMCGEAGRFLKQGRLYKTARWIGWIQGVLWTSGVCSLEELRGHNRFM